KRIAAQFAVGDDVDAGSDLKVDGCVNRLVFDLLELDRPQLAGLQAATRIDELRRAEPAAHDLAADVLHGRCGILSGRAGRVAAYRMGLRTVACCRTCVRGLFLNRAESRLLSDPEGALRKGLGASWFPSRNAEFVGVNFSPVSTAYPQVS